MSNTTSVTRSELHGVLADYQIRLTGDNSSVNTDLNKNHTRSTSNPEAWPTEHRRVPDYRPINRNRDLEEVPDGSNPIERRFLTIMFTGVVVNATTAKLWGATAGPYFPNLFRYAIGGEW